MGATVATTAVSWKICLALPAFFAGLVLAEGDSDGPDNPELLNERYYKLLYVILGSIGVAIFAYFTVLRGVRYIRTLACLNESKQRYFSLPHASFAKAKEHFIYAPVFRQRHNREIRLSSALNVGTLPTRLQTLFLLLYVGVNVAFCVVSIDWSQNRSTVAGQLRNRAGVLATVNLIPLVLMASRNNPLIQLLNISYDGFNLMHRWIGRIIALEALTHFLAWAINDAEKSGWKAVWKSIDGSSFLYTGLIALVGFITILVQSPSIIRHAFYETFVHVHIALAGMAIGGLWIHVKALPELKFVIAVVVVWALERTIRLSSLVYRSVGRGSTKALLEALPGEAVRINIKMARPWNFKPGQHIFLFIPSIGLWTSHPFSVAWSESEQDLSFEKGLAMNAQDILSMQKSTMSLVVRRRTGFTDALFQKADRAPNGRTTVTAFVEGPYGGCHSLDSYGTVLLFAAGVGITHQVGYIRHLIAGFTNETVACRRVTLVWMIQNPEHLEWIRPWMTSILEMDNRRTVFRVLLFVTRPRSAKEIRSPSTTVQMFPGRPDIDTLVEKEMESQIGAMAVTVCGTGQVSDDVRRAVRLRQSRGNIDFVEEAFSW